MEYWHTMLRLEDIEDTNSLPNTDEYTGVDIRYRMFSRNAKQLHDLMHVYLYPRKWWVCICTRVKYGTAIDVGRWTNLTETQVNSFKIKLNDYLINELKCVNCPYDISQFGIKPIIEHEAGLEAILMNMGVARTEAEGCAICSPWWSATMCLQADLPGDTKLIIVVAEDCYQLIHVT